VDLYLHFPNTPSWRGAQLKHRGNFAFYLYLYHINIMHKAIYVHRYFVIRQNSRSKNDPVFISCSAVTFMGQLRS
jgi:hypothetical protein